MWSQFGSTCKLTRSNFQSRWLAEAVLLGTRIWADAATPVLASSRALSRPHFELQTHPLVAPCCSLPNTRDTLEEMQAESSDKQGKQGDIHAESDGQRHTWHLHRPLLLLTPSPTIVKCCGPSTWQIVGFTECVPWPSTLFTRCE